MSHLWATNSLYTKRMRIVVGVLRGGPSSEYEVSLKSGANVLSALDTTKYEPRDIFIDRQGNWHIHGMSKTPERALSGVDVAINIVHGEYGEDGTLQRILDALGVPYTGSDAFTSALAFNKHLTKEAVKKLGVKVAHGTLIDSAKVTDLHKTALNIFRSLPHPLIVKPSIGGSSVGINKVDNFHALEYALDKAFSVSPQALVEEFIAGKEATVGVIDDFRNEKVYALMPIEIIPPASSPFFDYEAKYSGQTIESVPGHFSQDEKHALINAAKAVHSGLGLSHYSRSDFIVSKRGLYFLEVNPAAAIGFTSESLFPKALKAVGARSSDFLDHIITLATKTKKKI
jgi:D-alanine-D-alanine ligase